jgi:hypothetical protein
MMKIRTISAILLTISGVVLLTACNLPVDGLLPVTPEGGGQLVLDGTIAQTLTAPANLATPGENDSLPDATGTATTQPPPCNQASVGTPFDVTIPDGTQFKPGTTFTKTWRLENSGACTWTNEYAVVWVFGDAMGISQTRYLREPVRPGEVLEISVDMVAPSLPGTYQSYWKLRNTEGEMFGIGPHGESSFWARIEVIETRTATPTWLPTATTTPLVFNDGTAFLVDEESLDLDSGRRNDYFEGDIALELNRDDELELKPVNEARLAIYGNQPPALADCWNASVAQLPVTLDDVVGKNAYVCFHSSMGLPGYMYITAVDFEEYLVSMYYVTWAIP